MDIIGGHIPTSVRQQRTDTVYSDRGQELLRIEEVLSQFTAARDAALDRLAAERAVNRLLQA